MKIVVGVECTIIFYIGAEQIRINETRNIVPIHKLLVKKIYPCIFYEL